MAIRVVSFYYKAPDPYPDTIMIVVVLEAFACLIRWRKNLLVRRQIAECINDVFCAAESEVDITGVVAAEEEDDEIDAKATDGWHIFCRECPKEEIVFLCQVIILYTVTVVSIYNLTVAHDDSTLWTALLSSSLGYLLPNPSLKR